MTYLEIEAFLAVIEHGTLTQAADHIFISQPALSKRISLLEEELGFRLIERQEGSRSITLTEKGKAFVPIAGRYKDIWLETEQLKRHTARERFVIYSSDGPHLYFLSQVYKKLMDLHPELSLKLCTAVYTECFENVQKRRADIAFTGADYHYKNVLSTPAYGEKMHFICRKDSHYPATVHPQELNAGDAVFSPYSTEFTNWFSYWCHSLETPRVEAHLIAQVEDFLSSLHPDIWTIAPTSVMRRFLQDPRLTTRPLQCGPPDRVVYVVRRADKHSPYIDDLLVLLRERISQMEDVTLLLPPL